MSEDFLKDPLSLFSVKGKTAVITGATGAFGALAAKVMAGAGANVVICANNAPGLKKIGPNARRSAARSTSSPSGRTRRRNCATIVNAAVDRFRSLDILVVASGQNKVAKIVDQKADDFLDVMDANVTQSWLMARAAGRQMLKQGKGGKVILMSSARGLLGHPAGYSAYCASKSAIDGITKALGCEWGVPASPSTRSGRRSSARRSPNGCSPTTSAARPRALDSSPACRRAPGRAV